MARLGESDKSAKGKAQGGGADGESGKTRSGRHG